MARTAFGAVNKRAGFRSAESTDSSPSGGPAPVSSAPCAQSLAGAQSSAPNVQPAPIDIRMKVTYTAMEMV